MKLFIVSLLIMGLVSPVHVLAQDQNTSQTTEKKKKREGGINPNESGGTRGAQTGEHRLEIIVHDEQNSPVRGGEVTVSSTKRKTLRGQTDEGGRWSTDGLAPGTYTVVVTNGRNKRERTVIIAKDVPITSVALILGAK
jgi:uncharacterized surface anchored protein